MKASELIRALQEAKDEHGDLEVQLYAASYLWDVQRVRVDYGQILVEEG